MTTETWRPAGEGDLPGQLVPGEDDAPSPQVATTRWPETTCSAVSCQARIYYAITEGGKVMPVDVEPVVGGTLELRQGERDEAAPLCVFVRREERAGRADLHHSHFATCKRAQAFRRPR